jgi:anti-sigma factor RsiW
MNSSTLKDITENELQAYVDDALSAERRRAVADFLAAQPEQAARLAAYQAQKQALKTLFDPVLEEALPEQLLALTPHSPHSPPSPHAPHSPRATPRPPSSAWAGSRTPFGRLAAGLLIALLGGGAGWLAHDQYSAAEQRAYPVPLARQAAIAHAVFAPDVRRPVEVSGAQEEQLVAWLSKRLGTAVRPPKLGAQGYELIGGRVLPGNSGPVAQFMYQDANGQRLTLFLSTENSGHRETAFRFAQEGAIKVFYWIDGPFGYALSGDIDKGQLARLARTVYDQLEHR